MVVVVRGLPVEETKLLASSLKISAVLANQR